MDPTEATRILDEELARGLERFAAAADVDQLEAEKVAVLGRKAPLSEVQRSLGSLPEDARRELGRRINEVFTSLREAVDDRRSELQAGSESSLLLEDAVDVTLPGRPLRRGSLHPLTIVETEIVDIFTRMGYAVVEGPEVEDQWHNFDALNIPPDHPARTGMDTTFLDVPDHPELVLRTHTSPMQIRTMESQEPPVYVIVPGRVFRNEEVTAKNMPVFHQVEGLAVDEGISFADLKGTLETFYRALLGHERQVRLTPSFFPFVEPGCQVEVSCFVCGGSGCKTCAQTGWIETMGAGMVHPTVLENVGYDPERYTGFAFGGGYDRLAMIRFGIPDIRLLWENDVRFLEQFEGIA
ncbi:MAG TPA: phenylalanine--tRNA ligase subunit alpha [Actinomycetota bacterium]|jgi:phenylalanyl-tRNA synthetase alpha chain|nr:phenylalanine--tRNA ligase subunit alpha [Actinomycetota bacterium]